MMTQSQKLLLETLAGHFAWLQESHPRKAKRPLAKRARRAVQLGLRASATSTLSRPRLAA
jgi:hypothetical protein